MSSVHVLGFLCEANDVLSSGSNHSRYWEIGVGFLERALLLWAKWRTIKSSILHETDHLLLYQGSTCSTWYSLRVLVVEVNRYKRPPLYNTVRWTLTCDLGQRGSNEGICAGDHSRELFTRTVMSYNPSTISAITMFLNQVDEGVYLYPPNILNREKNGGEVVEGAMCEVYFVTET